MCGRNSKKRKNNEGGAITSTTKQKNKHKCDLATAKIYTELIVDLTKTEDQYTKKRLFEYSKNMQDKPASYACLFSKFAFFKKTGGL
jgi:CRISPR/Cas system Type II protein with McrA/HNH and RuvC-like nuclease domain